MHSFPFRRAHALRSSWPLSNVRGMVSESLRIKAVLFDLGHTLVYSHHEETLHRILETRGVIKSIEEVREAMIKGDRESEAKRHTVLPALEFYTELNLAYLKHLGIADEEQARKLAEEINRHWFEIAEIHVYPDVKETLQRLKQLGLKLGIVTGAYEEDIEKILPKAGLDRFFDVSVGVDTVGKRKPHPDTFQCALRQLGIKPKEAIFVGDQIEADYIGARKIGMKAFLIQREGSPPADVRVITSLEEIFGTLG